MNCPCGGMTQEKEHKVKTLAKAQEWHSEITSDDLPVSIEQSVCEGCGRLLVRIYTPEKRLLLARG